MIVRKFVVFQGLSSFFFRVLWQLKLSTWKFKGLAMSILWKKFVKTRMIFKNVNIFYITRLLASAYNDCQSGLWSGQFSWSLSPINDKPPLMFCMSKARIFSSFINPKEHLLIFWNIEKAQLAKPVKRWRILKIMCHMLLLICFWTLTYEFQNIDFCKFEDLHSKLVKNLSKLNHVCFTVLH